MRGIARNRGFEILAIGGTDNHVHVLLSVPAAVHLVEFVRDLKANSSRFMKANVPGFAWQDGYAAISVSPSQVVTVRHYIANQAEHHRKRTFDEEFLVLLDKAGVRYKRQHALADQMSPLRGSAPESYLPAGLCRGRVIKISPFGLKQLSPCRCRLSIARIKNQSNPCLNYCPTHIRPDSSPAQHIST